MLDQMFLFSMNHPPTWTLLHRASQIVTKMEIEVAPYLEHRLHWLEGIADRIIVMRSGADCPPSNSTRQRLLSACAGCAHQLLQPLQLNSAAHGAEKNEFVKYEI